MSEKESEVSGSFYNNGMPFTGGYGEWPPTTQAATGRQSLATSTNNQMTHYTGTMCGTGAFTENAQTFPAGEDPAQIIEDFNGRFTNASNSSDFTQHHAPVRPPAPGMSRHEPFQLIPDGYPVPESKIAKWFNLLHKVIGVLSPNPDAAEIVFMSQAEMLQCRLGNIATYTLTKDDSTAVKDFKKLLNSSFGTTEGILIQKDGLEHKTQQLDELYEKARRAWFKLTRAAKEEAIKKPDGWV